MSTLASIRRKEPGAAEAFATRHWSTVVNYAGRVLHDPHEAEDVAIDVLMRLIDPAATFELPANESAYVRRAVFNRCMSVATKRRPVSSDGARDLQASAPGTDDRLDVLDAIQKLSDTSRLMIELHYYADESYEEIAKSLQLPIGTVRSRLFQARKELRSLLEDYDQDRRTS